MAYSVNTNGLAMASIEARNIITMEEFKIAECDPEDFCMFKWNASRTQSYTSNHNMVNSFQFMTGLSMVTRDVSVECYFDGSIVLVKRSESEKKFHYEAYGR